MPFSHDALLALQNGSDIRGVAIEVDRPVTLSDSITTAIAVSFAKWLCAKTNKPLSQLKIGVGHDSRLTADKLTNAFLTGALCTGAKAFNCGLASTPAMFMSTVFEETAFDAGVMITASHLPYDRNGIKFFTRDGGLDKADIKAILLGGAQSPLDLEPIEAPTTDLMGLYTAHLRHKIIAGINNGDEPLKGLHIVVDAGNGAGGFFADKVLVPLGASTSGSLFLEPDGHFPNHEPNPENKSAMAAVKAATISANADLGIIFDTDVDRIAAVLSNGAQASRDSLIALISALVAIEYPHSTIVTDSVTSDRLTEFLQNDLELKHYRFKRGYKNVIDEAIRLQSQGICVPLAIETSGHAAMSENYYLDDGAYLAVKLVVAAALAKSSGRNLSTLIAAMPPAYEEREYRIKILGENFGQYGDYVLREFEARAKEKGYCVAEQSFEGVRVSLPFGWLLLRKSLHDPLLPLNMEGLGQGDCDNLVKIVKELLADFDNLDVSVF